MNIWRGLLLLFVTIAIHQLGSGVLLALIPLRIAIDGMPASVAGAVSSAFSIGFLLGGLAAPAIIARLGVTRAMFAFTLINAAATALLWQFPTPVMWSGARLAGGMAVGAFFVIVEAWLGVASTASNRGKVFGTYMVLNRLSFMLAQLVFVWIDPRAEVLFLIVIALYLVSSLPASLIDGERPEITPKPLSGLLELPRKVPAAAAGSLGHGLITATAPALFPAYGVSSGLTTAEIALGLVAIQLGGLLTQMPIAYLSDRVGRRRVMAWLAAGTALLSLLLWVLPPAAVSFPVFLVIIAVWAGLPHSIYSISAAHANDRATSADRVTWASCLLVLWGLGATVGPLVAAVAMDLIGADAIFGYSLVTGVLLCGFFTWRLRAKPDATDSHER